MAEDLNIKKKRSEALRFLGKGKIDKAIEVYEEILKVKKDPDIYNSVGDLYVRKQNISKAIESYEKAFKLYKDEDYLDNAVAVIRKILKYEKDRKDLHLELADLYTELGNQDAALDALESVITDELDPAMLERAFSIITQLAEKVQEDESSVRRFERLFIELQEISERFGEISLESGMGMEMSVEEDEIFAPESSEEKREEEEGLIFEDTSESTSEGLSEVKSEPSEEDSGLKESQKEGLIFSDDRKDKTTEVTQTKEEQESMVFAEDFSKVSDEVENKIESSTEELIFVEEEPEEQPVIGEFSYPERQVVSGDLTSPDEDHAEVMEQSVDSGNIESDEGESDAVLREIQSSESEEVKTLPTEEIISTKPLERESPPTTTRHPEAKVKYYEEFKDTVLTLIEEMGEIDINELYDFSHPFETGMTLYRMELYDAAIDEFQLAMRESEYRLRAMEMIGRIFYELNNYELAIKMLEKALDEGGYEEYEYIGIRYYLGRAYESMGAEEKSLIHYEQLYLIDRTYRDVKERIDVLRLKRVKSF